MNRFLHLAMLVLFAALLPNFAFAACTPITIAPAQVTSAALQTPFTTTFSATGSAATPFAYDISSGVLPGLTLNASSGALSGTPTQAGQQGFTITATDANGCSGGRSYILDVAPAVIAIAPANGATAVALNTAVSVTFSESVNVTATAFKLECPTGTPVAFTTSPASPSATFTLTPAANLPAGVVCTTTVVAAQVTAVSDSEHPAADFTASFTTDSAPTVTTTTPTNGATNVALTSTVAINFNKSVNVTGTAFKLECPTGTPETFTTTPASPASAFTLTPSSSLPSGVTCTVTVVASQVTAAGTGAPMAADYVFSFSSDTAPTVTSTTPTNGATGVLASSTVAITFSESVNVTGTAFKLECPTGTPVAFTVSPASPATTYTLTPTSALPSGVTCTASVVASQVTGASVPTPMAADYVFTFSIDTPPTVTSTTPINGATNVLASTAININFSASVTTTGTSFKLECPVGTPVAFTVTPASPSASYTLTPSAPLPAGTTCTVTAVAAQIANATGTHLAANYVFSFTTDTPPTVLSTLPTNGATAVKTTSTLSLTFSKSVNVTGTAFKLECPTGTPQAFTVSPASPATTYTLTPTAPLPAGVTCTVTAVAAQITDAAGSNMTSDYVFSFSVNTPPTVASIVPANGTVDVALNATVTVNFSESVNVTGTAFKLECPTGTPVAFTVTPASPATSFVLHPSANLPAGVTCTTTVVAAQVTDVDAGQNMAANFVSSFTVDTAPTVTTTTPVNAAINVAPNSTIAINFSKSVNATGASFKLECPTGTPKTFAVSASPSTSFTLTPTANLPGGVVCTVTVLAAQVNDVSAGTQMAANFVFSFTVAPPPTVISVVPANGASNVINTTTVTVNFSTSVNVTGTAFKLECPTGTPVAFTVTPASPSASYVLHPTAILPGGVTCIVTVVANQVADVAFGQNMAANFTSTFGVDTPPTVTSTVPTTGATSVARTSTVTINFSKSVNVTGAAFKLECPAGTPVTFTVTPASPAASFVLHPTANLPAGVVCTSTVVATQVTDAVGSAMTADYVFTFGVAPVATADTYPESVIGHVSVNSAAIAYSVTANDTFAAPVTITAFDATTVHGGTIVMVTSGANMGQFTYNPGVGFSGPSDTFTYTISNAAGSAIGTVTIPVSGIIWFINNTGAAGDGRLATPFNTLAAFQAVNDGAAGHAAANANIFLYQSGTNYTGPVTLLAGQKLIGQDATSTLPAISGLTPGTSSAALPAMNSADATVVRITSAGNGVALGSGNTVWGLTLGNATGTALIGASVGALKIRDLTINTTGAAVSLASGALDAIVNSVTAGGGTHGISLTTTTGSFDVEGGGASDPANTTRGRTTAKNGGGTLTLGSGGTISGATSAGVLLSNATNVTLRNMTIQNNGSGVNTGGDGITATTGSTLLLDNDLVQNHAGNYGVHATGLAGGSILHTEITANATSAGVETPHVWNARLDNVTGTFTLSNSLFHNSRENIFGLVNAVAGTASLTATNSQFSDTTLAAPGNICLYLEADSTANLSLDVEGSTVQNCFNIGVNYNGNNSSGGGTYTVKGNTFAGNGGIGGGADINVAHQGLSQTVTADIENNTTRQAKVIKSGASISNVVGGSSNLTTVLQSKILTNVVGNAAVAGSGSDLGDGIAVQGNAGTMTTLFSGNTVKEADQAALDIISSGGTTAATTDTMNMSATNNDLEIDTNAGDTAAIAGLDLTAGGNGGADVLCLHLFSNVKIAGNSAASGFDAIVGEFLGTSTTNLQGYVGANNNAGQIATFLNTTATTVTPADTAGDFLFSGGTVKAAPSACPTPP